MEGSAIKAAAAKTTAVTQTPPKKPMTPLAVAKTTLMKYESEVKKALPKGWDTTRFLRIATTALSANPKLAQACALSPITFISAMMNSAQLGLEPNTSLGKAYLLPYNNIDKNTGKKIPMVQFQIGVYGYIDLAFRSGLVKSITAKIRHKKDFWEYEEGINQKLRHIPFDDGDPGESVGYYAVIHMKDTVNPDGTKSEGAVLTAYMPKWEVVEHAKKFSKSYSKKTGTFSGPWATDFDSMAKKTVLLQALKYAPKASEDSTFAKAFTTDATVRTSLDDESASFRTEGVDFNNGDGETVDAEIIEPADTAESED